MAFPEDISKINTNLNPFELGLIIKAVEEKRIKWGDSSLYGEGSHGRFTYGSDDFELAELFEEVVSLMRKSQATIPAFPNWFPYNELLLRGKLSAKTREWKWKHTGPTLLYTSTRTARQVVKAHSFVPEEFPRCAIVGIGNLLPVREATGKERERIEKEFGNGKRIGIRSGPYLYKFENLRRFRKPIPYKPPKGAVSVFKVSSFVISEALKEIGVEL